VFSLHGKPLSDLQAVTYHITQVHVPCLNCSRAGRYSIYLPPKDWRLSWPRWLVLYRDDLHVCGQSMYIFTVKLALLHCFVWEI